MMAPCCAFTSPAHSMAKRATSRTLLLRASAFPGCSTRNSSGCATDLWAFLGGVLENVSRRRGVFVVRMWWNVWQIVDAGRPFSRSENYATFLDLFRGDRQVQALSGTHSVRLTLPSRFPPGLLR